MDSETRADFYRGSETNTELYTWILKTGADLSKGSEKGTELYTWILKLGLICPKVLKQVQNCTHGY